MRDLLFVEWRRNAPMRAMVATVRINKRVANAAMIDQKSGGEDSEFRVFQALIT